MAKTYQVEYRDNTVDDIVAGTYSINPDPMWVEFHRTSVNVTVNRVASIPVCLIKIIRLQEES